MENYMIIANVGGVCYMTKVEAISAIAAEHKILNLGICGKREYGVDGCTAYDYKAMRTETFISNALMSKPVSLDVLTVKIEVRNAEIRQRDYAEKRITEIEKKIEQLKVELEENKKLIEK